uniref:Ig-like domain-containing protein n=1 Tax=Bos indicus x Bos taurus TaxID=30522 RepID=A0A4W2D5F7_BOBOX
MKRLAGTVLGLLFAQVCCVQGVDVEQSPPALSLQKAASYTLRCNFSTSSQSVNWNLQNPGGTKQDGRLNATTVPKEGRSSLHISSSQTTDSGTYFCAVQHSAPQAPAASTQTLRGAQPLPQPQSHREATTGHLQCSSVLIFISTVLTTDTFWPYRLWTLVFIIPSQHVSPSALETSNWELAE